MAQLRAAKRYAKALFDLAVEQGEVDGVREDLAGLRELLAASPDLAGFLANYLLPPERRRETLQALFAGKAHPLLVRFLLFLEARKRMPVLADVFGAFDALYDERQGIARVTVASAQPLTPAQREEIGTRMKRRLGREIRLRETVDPSLLGGLQIKVGDLVHDYSVETQLQRLRARLLAAV
jgi:F-type H+-transporting ATPase subunit delta